VVKVHDDEGIANRIGPEPCAGTREGVGEASVGERAGQPLSYEKLILPGCRRFSSIRKAIRARRVSRERLPTRRSRRPWHVRKLCVREPGELLLDPGCCTRGPHREGEEP